MDKPEETKPDGWHDLTAPDQPAPTPAAEAAPQEAPPAAQMQVPPIPVGLIPFDAVRCAFLVFPIPGAVATNRAGEQVRVFAVQVHTPMGVQTYATDERSLDVLGQQCREAVGAGISIAPANALDLLAGRGMMARRPRNQ